MKVLVVNCGSSSLKYQFIETRDSLVLAKGLVERIGLGEVEYSFTHGNLPKTKITIQAKNHTEALKEVLNKLTSKEYGVLESLDEIEAIGHRVVHGGESFYHSALITDEVLKAIEVNCELAPLHNPPNLQGILACEEVLPSKKQVAVFDTAFHQTMPEESYMYALPYEYYQKYKIRRYGFHGTSHRYVAMKAAEFLGKPLESLNLITCHLGNGSSITAIRGGKSIDTSMGFTPLEGVVMGTRSGSLDPATLLYIMEKESLTPKQMSDLLNKKSGILGLSGISNDMREINAAEQGNARAQLTLKVLTHSIRRYIGAYMVELGRVDAIIFTAGIGENDYVVRELCMENMENWGFALDKEKNKQTRGTLTDISLPNSLSRILVVPTNEELMIALETQWVIEGKEK
ncbi:acetate/propionate family kinase [Thermospira aquatica]|uniref:Acetate kinase n=1 Tax=Thermospira aquatica TaxID=2828656 RepID=A0AAX3BF60_9SPIR|nr:acetate kinase [Thermospira aquatica]URA10922.1 acetate kinase [Thermospira aquatica]